MKVGRMRILHHTHLLSVSLFETKAAAELPTAKLKKRKC